MFVTIAMYLVRSGEEDAFIALHEDWQHKQRPQVEGFLSAELLKNTNDARQFISLMRFEREEFAHVLTNDPEQNAWLQRLVSLSEGMPMLCTCISEWSLTT